MQCKKGVYFHLILLAIPSGMIKAVKNWGLGQRVSLSAEIYLLMGPNID